MKFYSALNVGDAQTIFVGGTEYNHSLLIDFGFESNAIFKTCLKRGLYLPFKAPNAFLLSHFHTDHYNGFRFLFPIARCFDFKNIYLPCMPVMQHREHVKLGLAFVSLAIRAKSIPMDVIEMIINASKAHPMFHIVGQGDSFYHNNAKYDVLWPPKAICDDEVLADVRRAIDSFEKLKEEDDTLKHIYHNLMDSGIAILLDGREQLRDEQKQEIFQMVANLILNYEMSHTRDCVSEDNDRYKEENDNLKKAANRLSIAFCQEGNLLFLGDLEQREIGQVVQYLHAHHKPQEYGIIHAAHHGTHWHNDLSYLRAEHLVISVGRSLNSHIVPYYSGLCGNLHNTFTSGDIYLESRFV